MKHPNERPIQLPSKMKMGTAQVPRKARSKLTKPYKEVKTDDQKRN